MVLLMYKRVTIRLKRSGRVRSGRVHSDTVHSDGVRGSVRRARACWPASRVNGPTLVALVAPALVALALAVTLSGCESTQERSAKLEARAKREKVRHPATGQQGLSIAHRSTKAKVLEAVVLHSSEGAAVAVTVQNTSGQSLASVPIAIDVKSASNRTLYQNDAAGLEASLTEIASLPAHEAVTWVDDQIPASGQPVSVRATIGEASVSNKPAPPLQTSGVHLAEASTSEVAGAVHNGSTTGQQHLVVYVTARRSGRIVAAGRAVIAEAPAGAKTPFQVFLIGNPAGAQLQASAPATTPG